MIENAKIIKRNIPSECFYASGADLLAGKIAGRIYPADDLLAGKTAGRIYPADDLLAGKTAGRILPPSGELLAGK